MSRELPLAAFAAVGRDRFLDCSEARSALSAPAVASAHAPFVDDIWTVYTDCFDGFTGATLDPLFHRLHAPASVGGRLNVDARDTVIVVGAGPSLAVSANDLRRIRRHAVVMTSLRGAAALAAHGVTPDIVVVQHASPLDARLSVDEALFNLLPALPPGAWVAAEPRTPSALLQPFTQHRWFTPPHGFSWGVWTASAVALALESGAGRIALVGVDLGAPGAPDPFHRNQLALLERLASIDRDACVDCGVSGAAKAGWRRSTLAAIAGRVRFGREPLSSEPPASDDARTAAERACVLVTPLLGIAQEARRVALETRGAATDDTWKALGRSVGEMMAWRSNVALRTALQDELGLSFLPRFWRLDVERGSPERLARIALLAADELLTQARRLEAMLGLDRRRAS